MTRPLPIDPHLPDLCATLRARKTLVLAAEPGAGKTTRVPPALLDALPHGQIWVLEPRRIAAQLAARRVAAEQGWTLGRHVGYQVRFDTKADPSTRLRFVTEGVLTRRLSRGPDAVRDLACVVLDEFHERHLETDLALTLLRHLRQHHAPDLHLLLMSATIDAERVARALDAPTLHVPGREHPVEITHAPSRDDRPLPVRLTDALADLAPDLDGHTLVFLPGVADIHRAERSLESLARRHDLALLPLHGNLPADDLDRALAPSTRRKILLATNLAESSVTLAGVHTVIDSGLARAAGYDPATGLPTLTTQPIAKDSAAQRAGRAGREAPGRCLRLYTKNDHDRRPRHTRPELLRTDLTPLVLSLRGAGVTDLSALQWLDPPPPAALETADDLLQRLGAYDDQRLLSPTGRALLDLPLPPRAARTFIHGRDHGVGHAAAGVAAILSERDPRTHHHQPTVDAHSDLLVLLDLLDEATRGRFRPDLLRRLGLRAHATRQLDRVRRQLTRDLPPDRGDEPDLLRAILAGHPDRVARRARPGSPQLALADGGKAQLDPRSAVRDAEWLVALGARADAHGAKVALASAIRPDWLLDLFPDHVRESHTHTWNDDKRRVEAQWQLSYGGLVIEASPDDPDPERAAELLYQHARNTLHQALDPDAFTHLRRRLDFARRFAPELPQLDDDHLHQALRELCQGHTSLAELRDADPLTHLRNRIPYEHLRLLDQLAPDTVTLHGGRRLEVHYEAQQDPWVRSRVQDFYGMNTGPTVGRSVPLVLHLQAPNKQSISVTNDLAGFWTRHYPTDHKALRRRYPKHLWPDDPATATPPKPGRIR